MKLRDQRLQVFVQYRQLLLIVLELGIDHP